MIALIVDIFSAVFSGANFGPTVVPVLDYVKDKAGANDRGIGHFFGAMRVDAFQTAAEFKAGMDEWIRTFRKAEPVAGQERVIIPGDPERESETRKLREGISLSNKSLEGLKKVSEIFEIPF